MSLFMNTLLEAADTPKVLLVQKTIWLNFKSDDATPIGWQLKAGMTNHGSLQEGTILIGAYKHQGVSNYRTAVWPTGEVKKGTGPEFLEKELAQLIKDGILKVLVK